MNAIGTKLLDPINLGLTQLWLTGCVDAVAESGRNPVVSKRRSLGVENERVNAGRDDRTCLARPNSQVKLHLTYNG